MRAVSRGFSEICVHALASGSSGNAFLVQGEETNLLIDAGLTAKTLRSHLARLGGGLRELDAILLTHEHQDHSNGAGALSRRTGAPVIANAATLTALAERDTPNFPKQVLPTGQTTQVGCFTVRSFSIPHNAAEPVGYVISCGAVRICYMTDTGHITQTMRNALEGATLCIVEANHDRDWLLRGRYPADMKAKVASELGHLSNAECAELVRPRVATGEPVVIWLAHLSRENNSPALAKRTVEDALAPLEDAQFRLAVALRDHPSLTWTAFTK